MPPSELELALQAGRAEEAEAICRRMLAEHPESAAVHDALGLILRARGQSAAAIESHRMAISLAPTPSQFHNNLGVALTDVGQFEEAAAVLRRALELAPDDPQIQGNLGVVLMQLGRFQAAKVVLARAVALQPESVPLRNNLGNVHHALGEFEDAIVAYRAAIQLQPQAGQAWCNLGVSLRAVGDVTGAIAAYDRAIELMPTSADPHMNRGVALDAAGLREGAIAAYRRAIAIDPKVAKAHYNLANTLADNADLEPAVDAYQRAIELRPDFVAAHSNLGNALMRVGRRDEAMRSYDRAVELDPRAPDPRWNRSLGKLLHGDYAKGWLEYEWRNRLVPPSSQLFPQPQWLGQNLAGKTILLHAEHGLGDTVQFVRYVPLVAARGGRVILRCQAELAELLRGFPGVDQLIVEGAPLPAFDVHCPLMSLPRAFGTRLDSIPNHGAYLVPDAKRVDTWRSRLASHGDGFRVGLSWAGSSHHQYDRQRSIALAAFASITRTPNVLFFNLQKGDAAKQLHESLLGVEVVDHSASFDDYADTASLMSQLDLVITVDTSIAHVAAAMGKPVWLLLAFAPDWRWLLDREDSPWYPSMRLFRQQVRNEWSPVIDRVAQELSQAVRDSK